ncbi:ribosome recycling factor [Scardovia inopinata]|uniref:Ribosome-recycling factor n=1 Tax=Scardovia inopinata F0304 TaxID=641146 RepID=W5IJY1_SCAIO|nr:ribosome recycling factor [Scardovia inopinata]EFG27169.1 ribosome-recycling factor [Scardovia inopinata F0304]BAR06781.1 ribosome recycling factor [Scardovia inopinata JCM 12537]SUV50844.1 ribosome recycling factor [Scardovia inopinata]
MSTVVDDAQKQMNKTIESTKENFVGIRTGRANPALFNGLTVDYYGAPTPLKALATIGVTDNRTLAVTPFDVSQSAAIEKAIRDSDLGVNPRRDGNVIHVTLPELTEERRKDYVKLAHEFAEKGKVAVRSIRRKAKEDIESATKDGDYGEDEGKRLQADLEKATKKATEEIDTLLHTKEKEILSV